MAAATTANNREDVRFSTYSGAPSLQPSLAPSTNPSIFRMTSTTPTNMNAKLSTATAYQVSATTYSSDILPNRAASTASTNDPRSLDIKSWAATIDRMSDSRLEQQRFVVSGQKYDEISTNALGAKLERALGRRMSSQDASFTRRSPKLTEKRSMSEVAAA